MVISPPSSVLPQVVRPMLALLAREPFDSPAHVFELKWEGIRALAFIEGGRLRLLSRKGLDITATFPEMAGLPAQLRRDGVVLDGELVCLDERGQPSYARLEERLAAASSRAARRNPVHFVAFDVLYVAGAPVMRAPLLTRKHMLHDVLAPTDFAQACDYVERDGRAFFDATCALGLEGIVAKEKVSAYLPGRRTRSWLKVKRTRDAQFVVGGYTFGGLMGAGGAAAGRNGSGRAGAPFASLLLGLYGARGRLAYVGQVSEGIPAQAARSIYASLQTLHVDRCPFTAVPRIPRFIYWCRPRLVCDVRYGEFTEEGQLAYPIFQALREDKAAQECVIADAAGWPKVLAAFT